MGADIIRECIVSNSSAGQSEENFKQHCRCAYHRIAPSVALSKRNRKKRLYVC